MTMAMTKAMTPGPDPESILVPPEASVMEIEPPHSLVDYTEAIERLSRLLDKEKATKVVLCIKGGPVVAPACSAEALQRWELAIGKLQRRGILLVAALDGPLCDLSLSLALACDFRLATADVCLPARRASEAGAGAHVPLPIWWLASLALHAGVLRAQQLLWRSKATSAEALLACKVIHAICPNDAALKAARLPVPSNVPLALLRRIVLQAFSISGNDTIGHSLAVSSLVIVDAVGRAAAAFAPLPPLLPLAWDLQRDSNQWVLTMSSDLERVSLDDVSKVMSELNKGLADVAASGGPLPNCLVVRLLAAASGSPKLPMPVQLLDLHAGGIHFNMKLVKWLSRISHDLP